MTDEEIKKLPDEEYGAQLRACRAKRGLTARTAAAMLGITGQAVINYEKGRPVKRFDKVELMRWMQGDREELPKQIDWRSWRKEGTEEAKAARKWAEELKQAREDRHLDQRAAAELLQVSNSTYSRWEIGSCLPSSMLPEEILAFMQGETDKRPTRIRKAAMSYDRSIGRWMPAGPIGKAGGKRADILPYMDNHPDTLAIQKRLQVENDKERRRAEKKAEKLRREKEARNTPAELTERCARCMQLTEDLDQLYPLCDSCREDIRKLKKARVMSTWKDIRILNRREVEKQAASMRARNDWYNWRCLACAHSDSLNSDSNICCTYIFDKALHQLPERPRPSADPCGCLYASDLERLPTRITKEQAMAALSQRGEVAVDNWTGHIYASIQDACLALDMEKETAKKWAQHYRKTGMMPCAKIRIRYATKEELELLREVAAGKWEVNL